MFRREVDQKVFIAYLSNKCENKYTHDFCTKIMEMYMRVIFKGLDKLVLQTDFACSYLIPLCLPEENNLYVYKKLREEDYIADVLEDKPAILETNDFQNMLYESVENNPNY